MYFESHAHYDDPRFDEDREALLALLPQKGIENVIHAGADMASSLAGICLADQYDYIYTAVGVHPHEVKNMTEKDLQTLEKYAAMEKVVAIGEIGLDYYYDHSPREDQRYWLKRQLDLAEKVDLPVIIHCRDAAQECFDIIKESNVRKGVIHCYSGSWPMALDYVKMGFYIGVGGTSTYKNAAKTLEVVEKVPLDRILLETDSPYLSPVPHRGERNDSRNLIFVAEKIAQIKGISHLEVANVTKENGIRLFFQ